MTGLPCSSTTCVPSAFSQGRSAARAVLCAKIAVANVKPIHAMTCFILTLLNRVEVRDSAGDNALDKLETGEVKYRVDNELKTCLRPIPSAQSRSDSSLRPIRFIMDAERKRAAKKAGPEETSSGQPAIGKAVKQDQVTGPATLTMPRVKPGEPSSHLVRAALKGALARVQAADPAARRGDVEGIHRLRTSCRRLRSELRTV